MWILSGASEVTAAETGCATNMPRPAPDAAQRDSSAEVVRCRGEPNILRGFHTRGNDTCYFLHVLLNQAVDVVNH